MFVGLYSDSDHRNQDIFSLYCSFNSCINPNAGNCSIGYSLPPRQQYLCTSAKHFMLIIGSASINLDYFIFSAENERVSIAHLVVFTYRSMVWIHWIGVLLDLWKSDFFIGDPSWGEPERAPCWSKSVPRELSIYVCVRLSVNALAL